ISFTANSVTTTLTFSDVSASTASLDLLLDNVRVLGPAGRILQVESSAADAVAVTVSPADASGLSGGDTGFTRIYPEGASVDLTTPAVSGTLSFKKWRKGDEDLAITPTVTVIMDESLTLTAVYGEDPPVITDQQDEVAVVEGGNAEFSVMASGSGTLSYQWRFNGEDIPDATTSVYQISGVQPSDVGSYDVVVSGSAGTVTSFPAGLTILIVTVPENPAAPVLSGTPGDMTVQFEAVLPGRYTFEWSGNLTDWTLLGETLVDTPRLLEFEHNQDEASPEPSARTAFYRIGFLANP
ncbi:MAG: hypothetical protein EOP88_25390, partial [Verrucomicrobiaceae bacterium]